MTDAAQKIAERVPLPEPHESAVVCLTPEGYAHGNMLDVQLQVPQGTGMRRGDVLYTAAQLEALRLAVAAEALRGAEAVVAPNVSEALAYSRNYATANPLLSKTAAEHILGLCDLLEKHASAPPAGNPWRDAVLDALSAVGDIRSDASPAEVVRELIRREVMIATDASLRPAGSVESTAHVGELDRTAPPVVWLQIDTEGDSEDRSEAIPRESWDHISWYYESMGGQEVRYVRADLAGSVEVTGWTDAMHVAATRAIWKIRREDEDRCDQELEDLPPNHSVWDEARAALTAALQEPDNGK